MKARFARYLVASMSLHFRAGGFYEISFAKY